MAKIAKEILVDIIDYRNKFLGITTFLKFCRT